MSTDAPETGTDDTTTDDSTDDSTSTDAPETGADDTSTDDLANEVEKWKAMSKKNEAQAKANAKAAKELEKLRAESMSETEKAVAEAEQRGRTAALTEAGERLAAAEIKAALATIVEDPAQIVEDLNLRKYLTDEGEVDAEAVGKLRTKYEAIARPGRPAGSADGGARGDDSKKRAASLEEAVNNKLSA